MEILDFSGYIEDEKIKIAQRHLIPKQIEENGLTKKEVSLDKVAISELVRSYTRESGVRNLEREIANVQRKVARDMVEKTFKKIYNAPNNRDVVVSCDKKWLAYLIPKGWITVDGVSLTVVDVGDNWFSISLIPETLKQTVLGLKTEGQKVNLEFDHTVKVIVHTIERMLPEIKENVLSNLKKGGNNKV